MNTMTTTMSLKTEKQTRLIDINNLCICLSEAIEKHYNAPDDTQLLTLIEKLSKKCQEYAMF